MAKRPRVCFQEVISLTILNNGASLHITNDNLLPTADNFHAAFTYRLVLQRPICPVRRVICWRFKVDPGLGRRYVARTGANGDINSSTIAQHYNPALRHCLNGQRAIFSHKNQALGNREGGIAIGEVTTNDNNIARLQCIRQQLLLAGSGLEIITGFTVLYQHCVLGNADVDLILTSNDYDAIIRGGCEGVVPCQRVAVLIHVLVQRNVILVHGEVETAILVQGVPLSIRLHSTGLNLLRLLRLGLLFFRLFLFRLLLFGLLLLRLLLLKLLFLGLLLLRLLLLLKLLFLRLLLLGLLLFRLLLFRLLLLGLLLLRLLLLGLLLHSLLDFRLALIDLISMRSQGLDH